MSSPRSPESMPTPSSPSPGSIGLLSRHGSVLHLTTPYTSRAELLWILEKVLAEIQAQSSLEMTGELSIVCSVRTLDSPKPPIESDK